MAAMVKRWAWLAAAATLVAACQGSVPSLHGGGKGGYGAIIVRGRATTPSGETYRARLSLGFESDEMHYVIPFTPGHATMYIVEPGKYRITPLRGPFGIPLDTLDVVVEGRSLSAPFPRNILRLDEIEVRPRHVVPIGVLNVNVVRQPGQRRLRVEADLDTSKDKRRRLVEEKVQQMLDPRVDSDERDTAVNWNTALDEALLTVQSAPDLRPAFKVRQ